MLSGRPPRKDNNIMNKPNEDLEIDIEEAIRLYAIDQIVTEEDIAPLEFTSYEDADLIEERYVDDEENYNEVDLDAFL